MATKLQFLFFPKQQKVRRKVHRGHQQVNFLKTEWNDTNFGVAKEKLENWKPEKRFEVKKKLVWIKLRAAENNTPGRIS